jgi:hypothetical protein
MAPFAFSATVQVDCPAATFVIPLPAGIVMVDCAGLPTPVGTINSLTLNYKCDADFEFVMGTVQVCAWSNIERI